MCLILFSYQPQSQTPLILGANRDEFFNRATQSADYWADAPQVLAGRDLVAKGTWLGITTSGRFAAVTNVREPLVQAKQAGVKLRSRGDLTREFLTGECPAEDFLNTLAPTADEYAGFNLLVGEFSEDNNALYYLSNRREGVQRLTAGVYGLSNHLLDSAWPKVDDGKQQLANAIEAASSPKHQVIRDCLENPLRAADKRLPDTGVGYEREKALSSAFITLGDYGTRASTVLKVDQGLVSFSEQNYEPSHDGEINKIGDASYFEFSLLNAQYQRTAPQFTRQLK